MHPSFSSISNTIIKAIIIIVTNNPFKYSQIFTKTPVCGRINQDNFSFYNIHITHLKCAIFCNYFIKYLDCKWVIVSLVLQDYLKYKHIIYGNCRDGILVPVITCLTSFYGGFVIFCVVGFMAHEAGLPVNEVIHSGEI